MKNRSLIWLGCALFATASVPACGKKSSKDHNQGIKGAIAVSLLDQVYLFEDKPLKFDKIESCYLYQISFLYESNADACIDVKVDRKWETLSDESTKITWQLNLSNGETLKTFEQMLGQDWVTDENGKLYCSFYEGLVQGKRSTQYGLYYFLTREPAKTLKDIAGAVYVGTSPDSSSCEVLTRKVNVP